MDLAATLATPPRPSRGEGPGVRGSANAHKGKSKPEAIALIEGLGRLDYFPAAATRHARRHRRAARAVFFQPRLLGNRLTVDPRTLTPLVLVRIQVPQPLPMNKNKHLGDVKKNCIRNTFPGHGGPSRLQSRHPLSSWHSLTDDSQTCYASNAISNFGICAIRFHTDRVLAWLTNALAQSGAIAICRWSCRWSRRGNNNSHSGHSRIVRRSLFHLLFLRER